jgi:hypothetical protein
MSKPSIVFAHRLLADGFSFNKVIPAHQQEGLALVFAENPRTLWRVTSTPSALRWHG